MLELTIAMQRISPKTFYSMTSLLFVTSPLIFIVSISLALLPLVSSDLRNDAISPSSDRFPSFATNGHYRNPNIISSSHPPRRGQLKPDVLLKKLGSDFDGTWMSVEKPLTTNASFSSSPIDNERYEELANLNFTYRDEITGGEKVVKTAVRKYLEKWLMQRSSCPIRMTWVDVGVLFWPRWIRKGTCSDDGDSSTTAVSCSWPPGMHCVAKPHRPIRVLHWTCQSRSKSSSAVVGGGSTANGEGRRTVENKRSGHNRERAKDKFRCRWKKTRYPITAECVCSC